MKILVMVLLVSLVVNRAPGQECGGAHPPFDVIHRAAEHYCKCNFPTEQFKVDCLLSSCPKLSGVCPLTSNRSVNPISLTNAVSILNECIGQKGLICGYNMSHTTMADLSWTTAQLLPPSMVNGTIVHIPGSGYIENLSKATFTVGQMDNQNGPITLTIRVMNVTSEGYYNCTFEFPQNSIVRSLRGLIPDLNSPNIPYLNGIYHINVTATTAIDPATLTTVETVKQEFDLHIYFSNFVNSDGKKLPQDMVDQYNEKMHSLIKESVVPSAIVHLLSTYAAMGLRAAQLNCP